MNSQQRRIERYRIIYTWKVLEGKVPECGIEQNTESVRHGRLCKIPQRKGTKNIQKMRDSSFQSTGPHLFNSLPALFFLLA